MSGVYRTSAKRPIELTIVAKFHVNPWTYPPLFDFQYGDWLREEFAAGKYEPYESKEMPDLALLITQVLLASKVLHGPPADHLLCSVPYRDFLNATKDALAHLIADIKTDTRNVLLTYARIWAMLRSDTIFSKHEAVLRVLDQIPEEIQLALIKARAFCLGEEPEDWDGLQIEAKQCAAFMKEKVEQLLDSMNAQDLEDRKLTMDTK